MHSESKRSDVASWVGSLGRVESDSLEERLRKLQLPKASKNDSCPSTSTATATAKARNFTTSSTPYQSTATHEDQEIRILSQEERIRLYVHEHVAIWKKCVVLQPLGASKELKTLLRQAQQSQRDLQKHISRKEVEGYVQGWNPWVVNRQLFPPSTKPQKKAPMSHQMGYKNRQNWAEVSEMAEVLKGMYDAIDHDRRRRR